MRKRKPIEKIKVDTSVVVKDIQTPLCYNTKELYCLQGLCGEWFATCDCKQESVK